MKERTVTVDDILRALAEQDARLRAAFEALDPESTVPVRRASLARLAEQCTDARVRSGPRASIESLKASALRC
jgi:hypothetical protein